MQKFINLVEEYKPLIGENFVWVLNNNILNEDEATVYIFEGILYGDEDYYYAMFNRETGAKEYYSCVGSLKNYGFKLENE